MGVRAPTRELASAFIDSRAWDDFERRPSDIVIATPPKSGTTWMQGIVAAILWPNGDMPGVPFELSPWLDRRRAPDRDERPAVAAQQHRRFLKTHSPADVIPFDDDCSYIAVHRDLRDVVVSWANHRSSLEPGYIKGLNELAANDGVPPLDPDWDGDYDGLIEELTTQYDLVSILDTWWALRDRPNVLFVHFNDLLADLEGECRRVAAFLEEPVRDDQWPDIVHRCTIDEMREAGRASSRFDRAMRGGVDSFFNRGSNGRWQGVLTAAQVGRLASMTRVLQPEAADWLEHGSLALGRRPG